MELTTPQPSKPTPLPPLEVALAQAQYAITVGRDLAESVRRYVEEAQMSRRRVALIADRRAARKQADWLTQALPDVPTLTVRPGERSKSLASYGRALEFLAAERIDRHGLIFAFGGGVVGDLAGFAAASWLRGVSFVQLPTTLLAMVDSSVGGKTGINLPAGKNLVGSFHQPRAVFADVDLLRTLPPREFRAGMAEILKHALLGDAAMWADLEQSPVANANSPDLALLVRRNAALKARVVMDDEREQAASGGRALLNLGHTFAHAIEAALGYGTWLHGETVGLGLILAARLSARLEMIPAGEVIRVEKLVARYQLPTELDRKISIDELITIMQRDKKARAGRLRFVLLNSLGEAITRDHVPAQLVREVWQTAGAV